MKNLLPILKSETIIPLEGFTPEQSVRIEKILAKVPKNIVAGTFSKIAMDADMGDGEKYRAYGRYDSKTKIMMISPKAFKTNQEFDDGKNKMSKLEHVISHEIAHYIDLNHGISEDPEWLKLSGWSQKPETDEHVMMVIPQEGKDNLKSGWYYNKNSDFPRWYGKRSPRDDFAECFAFYVGGLYDRFKDKNKLNYIKNKMNKLGLAGNSV